MLSLSVTTDNPSSLLFWLVGIVIFLRFASVVWLCGVVTESTKSILGQSSRTPFSDARKTICQSTVSRQSEDRAHNNDYDDDDDDGVNALHAVVNEERVKVYGPV